MKINKVKQPVIMDDKYDNQTNRIRTGQMTTQKEDEKERKKERKKDSKVIKT